MKFIFTVIFLSVLWAGCRREENPPLLKEMKNIRIGRLDRDLFALDTLKPDIQGLKEKYGRYFDIYSQGVLNLGTWRDENFTELLALFIKDPVMREVADSVALVYADLKKQEKVLSQAWAYYTYYFPGHLQPAVYAHISGFNQSVVVDSAAVGISLDNYLGEHCVFYSMLAVPVPRYARKKMTAQDIPRDVLAGWLNAEFPFSPVRNDLISGMIYQGKIIFLLRKLFPEQPVHWIFGFSQEQEKWCQENESQIWSFLIENEYLFSTQQRMILKYLNDAPFTSGMPVESPGRAVVWTGWKIVEKYMDKTALTPQELMKEQDYHKIMRIAGYRP